MKFKRARRFGTTGALVAAAFGSSIVFTPASASAESEWVCYGTQVKRCATVWWNEATGTYHARAKITDVAGGGNYEVKVTNVKLQRFDGDRMVTVRTKADTDGWHATEDVALTASVDPCVWDQSFKVLATFSWRGASSGEKTWRPDTGWSLMC
ncbi:hypothetical protein SSPS47_17665 [Streptomyces sp. S4.7]|uniref:hypothetical protein n=1 Tax=Streptomyces sp. S4.7 TaxID=2705439 RepID=UPI001398B077|nr:hypothetical protein [Streptomyces sp. S4.7]QHY96937.1 hypothetical protein SSPS47_17665 [Streptomyces sp. S4.7]